MSKIGQIILLILTFKRIYGNSWQLCRRHDPLFIFRDHQPVKATQVHGVLRKAIEALGLDSSLYNTHSLRSGHSIDMLKSGKTLEQVKSAGQWRSNVVYCYIKRF